jgi:hypothetical protein
MPPEPMAWVRSELAAWTPLEPMAWIRSEPMAWTPPALAVGIRPQPMAWIPLAPMATALKARGAPLEESGVVARPVP